MFGEQNGGSFASGSYQALALADVPLVDGERAFAISAPNGDLLFYGTSRPNGLGLYTATHESFPNMVSYCGTCAGTTYLPRVLRQPGMEDIYHVLYLDSDNIDLEMRLCYATIAGPAAGGWAVTDTTTLLSGGRWFELIPGIVADSIILIASAANGALMRSWITPAGFSDPEAIAVEQQPFAFQSYPSSVDRSGTRMARVGQEFQSLLLDRVDRSNGTLSEHIQFVPALSGSFQVRDVEFSAGGEFLYLSILFPGTMPPLGQIVQMPIEPWDADSMNANMRVLGEPAPFTWGDLQLGPDDVIYISSADTTSNALGRILSADELFPSCMAEWDAVPLTTGSNWGHVGPFPKLWWPEFISTTGFGPRSLMRYRPSVQPVPASERTRLSVPAFANNCLVSYRWLDALGQQAAFGILHVSGETYLERGNLPSGLWTLMLTLPDGRKETLKMVWE